MGQRANGEGSIHQRKDGRWCASVATERGRRQHFLGRTRAEVARKLTGALDARDKGTLVTGPRQTVGQFFTQWLDAVRPSLRPRTFVGYEQLVRLHVIPQIGALSLARLTPQHLQRLYTSRLDAGLSSTTVNHIHALIHKALSNAVRWGLVHRNIADLVDPPRNRHFEIATLSPEQARAFLDAASVSRLEALFVLAVTTGMRHRACSRREAGGRAVEQLRVTAVDHVDRPRFSVTLLEVGEAREPAGAQLGFRLDGREAVQTAVNNLRGDAGGSEIDLTVK